MQEDHSVRFRDAAKFFRNLVQSYARETGITVLSVDLEDGRSASCRDTHLLNIFAEGTSVSVSVNQSELESILDTGAGENIRERIVRAIRKLGRRLQDPSSPLPG